MTRSVWRKRLKITGLVLSLMLLGLWVFSVLFISRYVPSSSQWSIGFHYGRIVLLDSHMSSGGTAGPCYAVLKGMTWHYSLGFVLPRNDTGEIRLMLPVWLLVLATGFPTAFLWWRDRRPKAGFCKACKYDLTGNVSGTCPECGTVVSSETG